MGKRRRTISGAEERVEILTSFEEAVEGNIYCRADVVTEVSETRKSLLRAESSLQTSSNQLKTAETSLAALKTEADTKKPKGNVAKLPIQQQSRGWMGSV